MSEDPYYHKYLKYKLKYIDLLQEVNEMEGGGIGNGEHVVFFSSAKAPKLAEVIAQRAELIATTLNGKLEAEKAKARYAFDSAPNQKRTFDAVWAAEEPKVRARLEKDVKKDMFLFKDAAALEAMLDAQGFVAKVGSKDAEQILLKQKRDAVTKIKAVMQQMQQQDVKLQKLLSDEAKKLGSVVASATSSFKGKAPKRTEAPGAGEEVEKAIATLDAELKKAATAGLNDLSGQLSALHQNAVAEVQAAIDNNMPWANHITKVTTSVTLDPKKANNIEMYMDNVNKLTKIFDLDSYVHITISGRVLYNSHLIGDGVESDNAPFTTEAEETEQ
jgi:hypothetical protein